MWLDLAHRPTLTEYLATDAYLDNLYRRVAAAYHDGYRSIRDRQEQLKAAREQAQQRKAS